MEAMCGKSFLWTLNFAGKSFLWTLNFACDENDERPSISPTCQAYTNGAMFCLIPQPRTMLFGSRDVPSRLDPNRWSLDPCAFLVGKNLPRSSDKLVAWATNPSAMAPVFSRIPSPGLITTHTEDDRTSAFVPVAAGTFIVEVCDTEAGKGFVVLMLQLVRAPEAG